MSIEKKIKKQFVKVPLKSDWKLYKEVAEYYFKNSAFVSTADIKYCEEGKKLLLRNINKRLFLGIGCELLVRSIYLKEGYYINCKKSRVKGQSLIIKRKDCDEGELDKNNLIRFDDLITNFNLISSNTPVKVLEGLKIAKTFRNKEAHSVFMWHKTDNDNYDSIEYAIRDLYQKFFSENLNFKIAFFEEEVPVFRIDKVK